MNLYEDHLVKTSEEHEEKRGNQVIKIYQCAFCRHFQGSAVVDDPSMPKGWRMLDRCAAFPRGIPIDILESRVDHRHAYPGDNGIVFAPNDPGADRLQALCFTLPVVSSGHADGHIPQVNV